MKWFLPYLLLVGALIPCMSQASPPLVVGLPEMYCPDMDCDHPETKAVIEEAYRRADLEVEFVTRPSLRDIEEANQGIIDASYARTRTAVEGYNNLIQIPVPYTRLAYCTYSVRPEVNVGSIKDIRLLRLGLVRGDIAGLKIAEEAGSIPHLVDHIELGFQMLKEQRLDALLTDRFVGYLFASHMGLENCNTSPDLVTVYTYHTLNKKHADLLPRLTQAFKSMLEDGTSKRLAGKYADMIPDKMPEQQ